MSKYYIEWFDNSNIVIAHFLIIDEVKNELTNTVVTMNGSIWTQISNDKRELQSRIGIFSNLNKIYTVNIFNKVLIFVPNVQVQLE